jgi:hypothetical protein
MPPNTAPSEPSRRYSTRAAARMAPNATAISRCHSHHIACQVRASATAIIASAISTNATSTASASGRRRRRYSSP